MANNNTSVYDGLNLEYRVLVDDFMESLNAED